MTKESGGVREKLITRAIELLSSRSYSAVGVQELCDSAGVTKGSFYHYFPSKRDLTLAAIDAIWDVYLNDFIEPALGTDLTAREKLDRLSSAFYDYYSREKESEGFMRGCKLGNLAVELSTQDEAIRLRLQRIFLGWIEHFEAALRRSVAAGDLPPDTDVEASARSIIAYLEGLALLGKTFNDPGFMMRLSREAYRLIVPGESGTEAGDSGS